MAEADQKLATLLGELRDILLEERSILLSGIPERVKHVVERKLQVAAMIESVAKPSGEWPADRETVAALDRYNRGNSAICRAMLRHLTASLDALRQRDCHRSYGPDGTEHNLPAQSPLGAA